jgi:hypothetical protein
MQGEHFGDLVADGENRIERCHRLLKDHGDALSADFSHLLLAELDQVLPLEEDLAADNPARRFRDDPHNAGGGHRFAAAGFAHNTQGFAFVQKKRCTVHGAGNSFERVKIGSKVMDAQ